MTAGRARGRAALALAVLVPAMLAAVATLLLVPGTPRRAPAQVAHGSAASLARLAALRPIVLHGRRTTLGTGPVGSSEPQRRAGVPRSFAIPSLGVDAPIEPVSANAAGIAVPRIGRAGWYDAGPRPGDPGRAVLIGHIDGKTLPGVFEHVPEIKNGSEIDVRDGGGRVHRFSVVGKLQVAKAAFPASAVYGPSERPVLVLVTCGGVYVPGEGYSDNVIVYARALAS